MYDFANVLFAGPCNRACPWCIGKQLPARVNEGNLDVFPPRGIDAFVGAVNEHRVREIVFTGTTTDPQLYRHEAELLAFLRERLHPDARFSVHTNGALAVAKMRTLNLYDRACVSFPSFRPETYEKMMGSRRVPDLARIVREAYIPVKVSCVIDEHNVAELDAFVAQCQRIGVRRVVLRRLYGETRNWVLPDWPVVGSFKGNPVMRHDGMEITYWDFDDSRCTSLNLFPDGTLGTSYLLTETPELASLA